MKCLECGRESASGMVEGRCANASACNRRRLKNNPETTPAAPPKRGRRPATPKNCGFCGRKAHPGAGCWDRARQLKDARGDAEAARRRKVLEAGLELDALECHVLYRFFDTTGNLLYVGITNNPSQRFKGHQKEALWFRNAALATLEHFPNRETLEEAERRAI